ncbi:hypothetical protein HQQ80_02015 [Microbacteriaceae bacterium VKM Ac-2855]|nr:hypothetical protein [Microbacteriaceae bacterium VKM Ac-2855]
MSEIQDRPASLRRKPRPAADEKVDPVDYQPAAATIQPAAVEPTPEPAVEQGEPILTERSAHVTPVDAAPTTARRGRPRGREVTIPFSTRVAQDVSELIDDTVAREGITQRSVIEMAVRAYWGSQLQG